MIRSVRKLFLSDSLGAAFTAAVLVFVVGPREDVFGMPSTVVYGLAVIAIVLSVYSLCNFIFGRWPWLHLKIVALANVLYCFLSIAALVWFRHQVTTAGILYFTLEVVVILVLARFELKAWANRSSEPS